MLVGLGVRPMSAERRDRKGIVGRSLYRSVLVMATETRASPRRRRDLHRRSPQESSPNKEGGYENLWKLSSSR